LIRDIKTSIKQRNNYIHMYSHVFTYWQRNGVSTKRNVVSVFFTTWPLHQPLQLKF
jgi:hypothetical protein